MFFLFFRPYSMLTVTAHWSTFIPCRHLLEVNFCHTMCQVLPPKIFTYLFHVLEWKTGSAKLSRIGRYEHAGTRLNSAGPMLRTGWKLPYQLSWVDVEFVTMNRALVGKTALPKTASFLRYLRQNYARALRCVRCVGWKPCSSRRIMHVSDECATNDGWLC